MAGQAAAFRELFPAALCYTKIVPVDEVVTLTLYYREDDQLRRLLLSEAESAEIDRLWRELHFVSQDALQSVDAYDQLWQFATQDADPSAFEPLREPIRAKAAVFREEMKAAEPRHVDWLVGFAPRAWRRAVSAEEGEQIRGVYARLRADEVPHEEAVRLVLARILTSPAFLYRGEKAAEGKESAPVSDAELSLATSYLVGVFPIRFETTAEVAGGLANVEIFRLPTNYFDTYRDRVKAVTAQDVLRVAQTHLDPSRLQVIVVGDATAIRPTVEALSLGPVTVYDPAEDDVAAAPVSSSSAS
jgi:hypothetical protein